MNKTRNGILVILFIAISYSLIANKDWRDLIGAAATAVVRPVLIPLVNVILEPANMYNHWLQTATKCHSLIGIAHPEALIEQFIEQKRGLII